MGLTDRLAAVATRRAHALVVEVPGGWELRVDVQRALAARGWREALSPAEADLLVVCGRAGPQLGEAVDLVWDQLPGPRSLVEPMDVHEVDPALDAGAEHLRDTGAQRADARDRRQSPETGEVSEMAPAGIPLAEGGQDRDGLAMDELHVPLGPVLAHWPAGLVLHTTLQGDVVVAARAELLDAAEAPPPPSAAGLAAWRCDAAAGVLALAGWWTAAAEARAVRDLLLDAERAAEEPKPALARRDRLADRVRRSRLLRWQLHGLGVHEPLLALLDADGRPSPAAPDDLAERVTGLDLAATRLVVAALAGQEAVALA